MQRSLVYISPQTQNKTAVNWHSSPVKEDAAIAREGNWGRRIGGVALSAELDEVSGAPGLTQVHPRPKQDGGTCGEGVERGGGSPLLQFPPYALLSHPTTTTTPSAYPHE